MRGFWFLAFLFCLVSCNIKDFLTILREKYPGNVEIYQRDIQPIFAKYNLPNDKINMIKFVSLADYEDIVRVLVGLKTIIPEDNLRDLIILSNSFYMFHFRAKPLQCAELMMRLPNGQAELEIAMRKDREVTFNLVRKIVSSPLDNNEIISMALQIYSGEESFVNDPIGDYSFAVHSYTYLLHEACKYGNAAAVRLLLNNGADPELMAGNSFSGPIRNALNFAVTDLHGTDTLEALLAIYRPNLTDEQKKKLMQVIEMNSLMSDVLRSLKIQVLKQYGVL